MLKKLLLINPIIYTIIMVGITFFIQFLSWWRLAYFVVDTVDSWWQEACQYGCMGSEMAEYSPDCYYYGWCWSMVESIWLPIIETLVVLLLGFFAWYLPFMDRKYYYWSLWWWFISYFLISVLKGLDWFGRCSDFCWIEYIFIYPILFWVIFLISFGVSFFRRKSKK